MKHMGLIPARLSSQRLKDKPLQLVDGQPLCLYVAESLIKTNVFDQVIVATDSEKVMDVFKGHDAKALMTDPNHQSGTDRIHEVVETLGLNDDEVIFNIQGDEPLIYREDLLKIKEVMEDGAEMASLYEEISSNDIENLNKVKVLINKNSEAIYFSRYGIPFSRVSSTEKKLNPSFIGKHIGLYAYTVSFLKRFCDYKEGFSESCEKLEQLRALEMGTQIKMIFTKNSYQGVDTIEDLEKINEHLSKRKTNNEG